MTIVLSLLHLAKQRPDLFNNEQVVEALCSLLKKDAAMDASKSKGNFSLSHFRRKNTVLSKISPLV